MSNPSTQAAPCHAGRLAGIRSRWPAPFVAFYLVVVVAAGISGAALLVAPGSTEKYFSWTLRPPAAASLIGGFYLASASVFGWGLTLPWRQARVLLVGVLGLAVPTVVLTLVHDEVFDFGRWQALAWVALFVIAPVTAGFLLRSPTDGRASPPVPSRSRAALGLAGLVLLTLAVLIWLDTTRDSIERFSPVDLVRLTGTYLGAWCSLLAAVCGFAAFKGRWDEAHVALVTLTIACAGAILGIVRSLADVRHPLVAILVAAAIGGAAVVVDGSRRP